LASFFVIERFQNKQSLTSIQLKRTGKAYTSRATRLKRSSMPMLVPRNSILLWKDPVDPRTNERSNLLSLLFNYQYNDKTFLITLRRPIEFKIHKITTPQKSKKTAVPDSIPSTETSEAAVSVEASSSSNKADSLTLEEVMDSEKHLVVGGTPYSIIREPVDIASISCSVKPLAGCPIYPAIDFRQGTPTAKPTLHWYIYTPPASADLSSNSNIKDAVGSETISLIEGSSRRFSVTNCEYRWTGDCYVPSAADSGSCYYSLLIWVRNPLCGVSKYPIEVVDEPLIFEENIKWCQERKPSANVSYNILADLYLDLSGPEESLFFPYCPKAYQMHEYRYPLLLKELQMRWDIGGEL
ncbi:hypothetical protein COOONC_10618, partial [Cooperia oncophora]